jgi:hypothetical protein
MHLYNQRLGAIVHTNEPLDLSNLTPPIVVIPLRRLDRLGQKALRFALTIAPDIYVVQVLAEELDSEDLQARWDAAVREPVRQHTGRRPPELVLVHSPYREFYQRLLTWVHQLTANHPDRQVIVLIPELVQRRWFHFLVSYRVLRLKALLLLQGGPHVSVMSTPWYPDLRPARAKPRRSARQQRRETTGEPSSVTPRV